MEDQEAAVGQQQDATANRTFSKGDDDCSDLKKPPPIVIDVDKDSGKIMENDSDDDSDVVEIVQVNPPSTKPPPTKPPPPSSAVAVPRQPFLFTPYFFERKAHCTPTWTDMHFDICDLPTAAAAAPSTIGTAAAKTQSSPVTHFYKLHLLSQTDFSVSNVSRSSKTVSMQRLGVTIRKISREHSVKAVFEHGMWRIPLSIYQPLFTCLSSEPNTFVEGIPNTQLKIVALARTAAQMTESSPAQLMQLGVPEYLATALAPYQRAGVDFCRSRQGRFLLADEMGLGKSIQSIASMCLYRTQWPLLVICPSSATHHWKNEFMEWLGHHPKQASQQSTKRKRNDQEGDFGVHDDMESQDAVPFESEKPSASSKDPYISSHEIQIVSSSKSILRADPTIQIVICSYGFASKMAATRSLVPGMFQCIIADESHLLKNKSSVRTKNILPILQGCKRLILLSGTPALSRPIELYPQISAIGNMNLLWRNEDDYAQKYCKGLTNSTSTNDEASNFTLHNPESNDVEVIERNPSLVELHTLLTSTIMLRRRKKDILKDLPPKNRQRLLTVIRDPTLKQSMMESMTILTQGKGVLASMAKSQGSLPESSGISTTAPINERNAVLKSQSLPENSGTSTAAPINERKAVLNELYCQAGQAKIPVLIEFLNRFIQDPSKGKLCVFVHHTAVMNALIEQSKLSDNDCMCKFIRIDGTTLPKDRQDRAQAFQSDPMFRIAILGITSAGVALTLTACSTVWFAELFWTPAILLQAEDRCHRIGQTSSVRCVYFVARESLDELLWKLIQKKFMELGEFVEGQGNQNMIVHHDYHDENEAMKSWFMDDPNSDDDKLLSSLSSSFDFGDDEEIRLCIEALVRDDDVDENEINTVQMQPVLHTSASTDKGVQDDDVDQNEINTVQMQPVLHSSASTDKGVRDDDVDQNEINTVQMQPVLHSSASTDKCIDLLEISDDEDTKTSSRTSQPVIQTLLRSENFLKEVNAILPKALFPDLRLYRYYFPRNFDLGLQFVCGRFVNTRSYSDSCGKDCRPGIGDVIVGFQGRIFGLVRQGEHATKILSIIHATFQSQPYVEVIFGEDKACRSLLEMYNKQALVSRDAVPANSPTSEKPAMTESVKLHPHDEPGKIKI